MLARFGGDSGLSRPTGFVIIGVVRLSGMARALASATTLARV